MIQEYLKETLETVIPDLNWSVDYRTGRNTGSVYSTGSDGRTDMFDTRYRYPTYQVYISTEDWDFAKTASELVYRTLHKAKDFYVTVRYEKDGQVEFESEYYVFLITAVSDPIRIGESDGEMQYSLNFDVILTEAQRRIP